MTILSKNIYSPPKKKKIDFFFFWGGGGWNYWMLFVRGLTQNADNFAFYKGNSFWKQKWLNREKMYFFVFFFNFLFTVLVNFINPLKLKKKSFRRVDLVFDRFRTKQKKCFRRVWVIWVWGGGGVNKIDKYGNMLWKLLLFFCNSVKNYIKLNEN